MLLCLVKTVRRTVQSQVIAFRCKTGPENSESRRLGSKTTLELSASNTGKKDFKLTSQVPAADFVFESFALLDSENTPNSSSLIVAALPVRSSAPRRWAALCWILPRWLPIPCLTYIGRMKQLDVRQVWREKHAFNINPLRLLHLRRGGPLICPTQHARSASELAGHSLQNYLDNVVAATRGEVFDLTKLPQFH
ncbi:hypothetical protein PM082_000095 [Marasmius tenuissimus]|nr:hypothetical protein PM082_000095 [Marasmius tenuissimus]